MKLFLNGIPVFQKGDQLGTGGVSLNGASWGSLNGASWGYGFRHRPRQVEAHFCEELVGAAKQTHGWVITGRAMLGR